MREARDAAKHPTVHRTLLSLNDKNYPAPNVNRAKVKNAGLKSRSHAVKCDSQAAYSKSGHLEMDQNLLTRSWDQLETQFQYLAISALLGLSHICEATRVNGRASN